MKNVQIGFAFYSDVGGSDNLKVELSEFQNGEYDALLLCSDGFWEYVLESEMESIQKLV